jgi:mannose PTS system EIIA component
MIAIIVITHGLFGNELLRTAQDMVGRQEAAASLSVTAEMGIENLHKAMDETIAMLKNPDGYLFLVDMLGGTPCNASLLKTKDMKSQIVTGVNLYMVISSFKNRPTMELDALAAKVAEDGRRAVTLPREMLKQRLG